MAARFIHMDDDTPLFLPPTWRAWGPAGPLAPFMLEAVPEMALRQVQVNERGSGGPPYPPRRLLALLLYGYATGVCSSRLMERAALESVPGRMIGGGPQPDHDTLGTFRRENKALLQETCVRVLALA
jgi:transposase